MADAELGLRPPTQEEFEQWLPCTEAAYAREIAESGAMTAAAAKVIRKHTIVMAGPDMPGSAAR